MQSRRALRLTWNTKRGLIVRLVYANVLAHFFALKYQHRAALREIEPIPLYFFAELHCYQSHQKY